MRATDTIRTKAVENGNTAKNVILFVAAPFIGLGYAVLLPFVGMAMLIWTAGKALVVAGAIGYVARLVKNVALLIAAPFIGLIYAVTFPFVGIALLLWTAVDALTATLAKVELHGRLNMAPRYQAV